VIDGEFATKTNFHLNIHIIPNAVTKNTLIKREFAYFLIGFHSGYYFNTKEHSSSYTVRCEFD